MVKVRARVKKDLEDLIRRYQPTGVSEIVGPMKGRDYPYRVFMEKKEWAKIVFWMTLDIDYTNFKSRIEELQGEKREAIYARVWGILNELEKLNPPEPIPTK